MEINPKLENIQEHNRIKEAFNKQKILDTQSAWEGKTSSLNMEKDTAKLWKIIHALNDDTTSSNGNTVLKENNTYHSGKMAANILADYYRDESITLLPKERIRNVRKEIKEKLKHQNQTPP